MKFWPILRSQYSDVKARVCAGISNTIRPEALLRMQSEFGASFVALVIIKSCSSSPSSETASYCIQVLHGFTGE